MKNRSKNGQKADKTSSPVIRSQLQAKLQQALVCHQHRNFLEAELLYAQLIKVDPHYFDVLPHYARLAYETKRPQLAVELLSKAVKLKPGISGLHSNLGLVLHELGRVDEALASYDRALALTPQNVALYICRATILTRLGRFQEALESYDRAIAIVPSEAEFHYARGFIFAELVELDCASEAFRKTLELNPNHHRARWCLALSSLPAMFHSEEEVGLSRNQFELELSELSKWFVARLDCTEDAVAAMQPFYLAYQDQDNKDILSRYGSLTNRLMSHWQAEKNIWPSLTPRQGKIRIGVVSSLVSDHPVWEAIATGWLLNFDANLFEWHVFSLTSARSNTAELIRRSATSFVEKVGGLAEWAATIVKSEMEVLIYPEIGMEGLTVQLANLRLAPLQIATWGHPETSGLKTIDYYLSAELFEPEDGDLHYVESLIRLPNLGCTYRPHNVDATTSLSLETLDINPELPVLICPGTAFKYSPKYDGVFPEIACRLGLCTFVFFEQKPHHASILKERLISAFSSRGLEFDRYVKFVPWLPRDGFYALMKRSDVLLDTIGFSGFNTTMQAIECSLPIVGFDGRFMRGRLASGILKRLELTELICSSVEDYCNVVTRIVQDKDFRAQMVSKIESRREVLYNDLAPLRALERFLIDRCSMRHAAEL